MPIAVADHGLQAEHLTWLERHGVLLLDGAGHCCPRDLETIASDHAGHPKAPPAALFKPLVCLDSPFDRTIWIDADAVLLRGIAPMFAALESGPWVTRDWWIAEEKVPRLYAPLVSEPGQEEGQARFLQQNEGTLSRRARNKEFSALTDEETQQVEDIYRRVVDEAVPPY